MLKLCRTMIRGLKNCIKRAFTWYVFWSLSSWLIINFSGSFIYWPESSYYSAAVNSQVAALGLLILALRWTLRRLEDILAPKFVIVAKRKLKKCSNTNHGKTIDKYCAATRNKKYEIMAIFHNNRKLWEHTDRSPTSVSYDSYSKLFQLIIQDSWLIDIHNHPEDDADEDGGGGHSAYDVGSVVLESPRCITVVINPHFTYILADPQGWKRHRAMKRHLRASYDHLRSTWYGHSSAWRKHRHKRYYDWKSQIALPKMAKKYGLIFRYQPAEESVYEALLEVMTAIESAPNKK